MLTTVLNFLQHLFSYPPQYAWLLCLLVGIAIPLLGWYLLYLFDSDTKWDTFTIFLATLVFIGSIGGAFIVGMGTSSNLWGIICGSLGGIVFVCSIIFGPLGDSSSDDNHHHHHHHHHISMHH